MRYFLLDEAGCIWAHNEYGAYKYAPAIRLDWLEHFLQYSEHEVDQIAKKINKIRPGLSVQALPADRFLEFKKYLRSSQRNRAEKQVIDIINLLESKAIEWRSENAVLGVEKVLDYLRQLEEDCEYLGTLLYEVDECFKPYQDWYPACKENPARYVKAALDTMESLEKENEELLAIIKAIS